MAGILQPQAIGLSDKQGARGSQNRHASRQLLPMIQKQGLMVAGVTLRTASQFGGVYPWGRLPVLLVIANTECKGDEDGN